MTLFFASVAVSLLVNEFKDFLICIDFLALI